MSATEEHWQRIYGTKAAREVSWYEPVATTSLALIEAAGAKPDEPLVDVGAGASVLVDGLLERGFSDVTLVDVSPAALETVRARLGEAGRGVRYVATDLLSWAPERTFALWHDRAVLHFLVDAAARDAYRSVLSAALRPGGAAVIATFADDGPERCSGLPVRRYSPDELAAELAPVVRMVDSMRVVHTTPWGAEQRFVYGRFVRD
ncbi:MAG TPA: class I SAM-dependent methyltransferase [Polyangiaceae bacterium]|nr:class I SAM-dependent methyltransferase [Polyangiaceae bacterium]